MIRRYVISSNGSLFLILRQARLRYHTGGGGELVRPSQGLPRREATASATAKPSCAILRETRHPGAPESAPTSPCSRNRSRPTVPCHSHDGNSAVNARQSL